MSDDGGLSTQQLVEQAKQLAKSGHLQEAIDMTDGISHPKIQEWRNGLKARLAQQKIADRKKEGRRRQVYIGIAVVLIAVIAIATIVLATRNPQMQQDTTDKNIIVLVTNTITPDLTSTASSKALYGTAEYYAKQNNATYIAQGTPCHFDCPDGYSTPTFPPE